MVKSKWMMLLTESFFPFLFGIIVFLGILFYVDNRIENRDDILLINLNREDVSSEDDPSIIQTLQLKNLSPRAEKQMAEINQDMANEAWSQAIRKIRNLESSHNVRDPELKLTLAYIYYKKGEYQDGINTLAQAGPESGPRFFYNMGLLLSKQPRHYKDAVKNFEKFLEFKNNSYEASMNIGHIYFRLEQYPTALLHYKKSADISSLARRARALYWEAVCFDKTGDKPNALRLLDESIKLDPENPSARARRAELELKKNPEEAIADLVRLTEIYPEFIDSYHILASYYLDHDENEKALNWMKTGLLQAPNSTRIRSNLGSVYLKLGENEKARDIFQELSEKFPDDHFYQFNLAKSWYGLGNSDRAIEYYNKALKIKPRYYEALVNLGIIYSRVGNPDMAIRYYNKALEIDKTSSSLYFNLGVLYGRSGRYQAAIRSYEQAIAIKPDYPVAWYNMGLAWTDLSNQPMAESAYLKALGLDKGYVNAYANLAYLYKSKNESTKALRILENGVAATGNSKLKNRLADYYEVSGETDRALAIYDEVIKGEPENETTLLQISKIHFKKQNYKEVQKYIQQYINLQPRKPEGRYVYMMSLYKSGDVKEAMKQYEILNKLSPGYKDSKAWRDLMRKQVSGKVDVTGQL